MAPSDVVTTDNAPLVIGKIHGVYGVKGWVKVFSHTQPRENILRYHPWLIQSPKHPQAGWQTWGVQQTQVHNGGKTLTAHLEGVDDREQAKALMGAEIAIWPQQLPPPEQGYYWVDLIQCSVWCQSSQTQLGKVIEMVETGAHDVMRVQKQNGQTLLIPFVMPDIVQSVDLEQKHIWVEWHAHDAL